MYTETDMIEFHEQILEQLANHQHCSNFILTEKQLTDAINTKQNIIKPYVIPKFTYPYFYSPEKKEYINIRDFVLEKLKTYKIIGCKTGNYDYFEGNTTLPGGSGYSWRDSTVYIIFINMNGELYKNTFLEYNHASKSSSDGYAKRDWFLEFFIKPFAIYPSNPYNKFLNPTYGGLDWMPYIDPIKFKSTTPKYKEYIETDKIIPKKIMTDILNGIVSSYNTALPIKNHIYVILMTSP